MTKVAFKTIELDEERSECDKNDYVDEEDKRGKLLQMIANVANHEWVVCEKSIIHKTSNSGCGQPFAQIIAFSKPNLDIK